jgi:hypothetical protein
VRLRVTPTSVAMFEWESGASQFRVGRGDQCALRFQGEAGATISWEHVEIISHPDGSAYVTDLRSRNGTFVDGSKIGVQTPITVGSIMQLGRLGPSLQVLELTAPIQKPTASMPVERARIVAAAAPLAVPRDHAPDLWMVRNLGGISAVIVIVTLGYFALRGSPPAGVLPPPPSPAAPLPPPASAPAPVAAPVDSVAANVSKRVNAVNNDALPRAPAVDASPAEEKPIADPWDQAKKQGLKSFRLIVVEDPKSQASWPFAGAIIVGEKMLLTTASMGVELTKFVERGWHVTAMRPGQQSRVEVTDLRVHAAYEHAGVDQQLYFDMAVLLTTEPLGEPAVVASPTELAGLERGLPLVCLAVDHEGDPMDRFQQLAPQTYPCKVFSLTGLPPQPSGPRLLLLRGSITDKGCGSPIFNQQGHLIALYCEPAPSTGSTDLHMHYAKVVDPQAIDLALHGADERVWVRPHPPAETSAPKEPSK